MVGREQIPPGKLRPGDGRLSKSWWRSLLAAYRAVASGTNLDEHNIRMKSRAIRRNQKAAKNGSTPRHSAFSSDGSDSDRSHHSHGSHRSKKDEGGNGSDDGEWDESDDEYTQSEIDDWKSVNKNEHLYMLKRTAAAENKNP